MYFYIYQDEEAKAGRILNNIHICAYANPIGLSQSVLGYHVGRFSLDSGTLNQMLFKISATIINDDTNAMEWNVVNVTWTFLHTIIVFIKGVNFNREWPDISKAVISKIGSKLIKGDNNHNIKVSIH